MALRPATDRDWQAMTGMQAPQEWFGFVEAGNWFIEGLGAIYRGTDDRWWITFLRAPGVRKVKQAHVAAKMMISVAKDRNLTINGLADPEIGGADLWMQRLGFKRTEEKLGGIDVWTL